MIVKKYDEVEKEEVNMEGAKNISVRRLIREDSDAPNFYMRFFEIEPGGYSPFHSHPFEHEVYVVEGKGQINTEDKPITLEKGSFALVVPGEKHQFVNRGHSSFKFLCMIPKEGKS